MAQDLNGLIRSGTAYPPALARARERVERSAVVTAADLERQVQAALTSELQSQPSAPAVLARAASGEPGYRNVGEFYWLVGIGEDQRGPFVRWVSEDYHVYQDSASVFDVSLVFLHKRFGKASATTA